MDFRVWLPAAMLSWLRRTRASMPFAALYALAMITLGYAHQPVAIANATASELAAYQLPDGSLPPICGHGDQNTPGNGKVSQHCDACALSGAPGLLPVATRCVPGPVSRVVQLDLAEVGQFAPAALHAPLSRGPPLS